VPNFASDHAAVSFNAMSIEANTELLTTTQKARRMDFDAPIYGTFAEIEAGQGMGFSSSVYRQFAATERTSSTEIDVRSSSTDVSVGPIHPI